MESLVQQSRTETVSAAIIDVIKGAARSRANSVCSSFINDEVDALMEKYPEFKKASSRAIARLTMRGLAHSGYLLKYKSRGKDREVILDIKKITSNSHAVMLKDVMDFEREQRINVYKVRKSKKEAASDKGAVQPELALEDASAKGCSCADLHRRMSENIQTSIDLLGEFEEWLRTQ